MSCPQVKRIYEQGPDPVKRFATASYVPGGAEEARSSAQFLG